MVSLLFFHKRMFAKVSCVINNFLLYAQTASKIANFSKKGKYRSATMVVFIWSFVNLERVSSTFESVDCSRRILPELWRLLGAWEMNRSMTSLPVAPPAQARPNHDSSSPFSEGK
jgi:hypothetical protein